MILKACNYILDEEQTHVVLSSAKHKLIIAGAGSGKTLTLIGYINYLISNNKCSMEEILCISFTNETVNQLKHKLTSFHNINITVLTFHKLAMKILEINNFFKIDNNYQKYIINELFESYANESKYLRKLLISTFYNIPTSNNLIYNSFKKKKDTYNDILHHYISLSKIGKIDLNVLLKKGVGLNNNFVRLMIAFQRIIDIDEESQGIVDLESLIIKASESEFDLPYKYIFVDEYQDISENRFQLLLTLLKQTNANLVVVGDDYQAIYGFSGSKLQLFYDFSKYFPKSKTLLITNTYRNCQELINIAARFISKNKVQIPKKMKSSKSLQKPILIYFYKSKKSLINLIHSSNSKDILILGRNNFDLEQILGNKVNIDLNGYFILNKKQLRFLTVHKAKGIEADFVIIINLIHHEYGFPNLKKPKKIDSYFGLTKKEHLNEERRLFYVALTRTKTKCILFTPIKKPSNFVIELFLYERKNINIEFEK